MFSRVISRSSKRVFRAARRFSEEAAEAAKAVEQQPLPPPASGGLFGLMFPVVVFGGIGGFLYRQSLGAKEQRKVNQMMDDRLCLIPLEIKELREGNKITTEGFDKIVETAKQFFPEGKVEVYDFLGLLQHLFGGTFQNLNLIERCLLGLADHFGEKTLTLDQIFYAITMCVAEQPITRMNKIFELVSEGKSEVSPKQIEDVVEVVINACQVPTVFRSRCMSKFPYRKYEELSPAQMVANAIEAKMEDVENKEKIDLEHFIEILSSKAVCLWGECYGKDVKMPGQ
eukprot:TRINITY_DN61999_c0_g1_i1.p1 TRINITY_DN61999_c0_g1~~TRINITY_DN61999_c0_g1_i1.p1  ORF type:complete len:285 (-),score=86.18 TRINITY_DN61999_c0_g1_i1:948-1802(-)